MDNKRTITLALGGGGVKCYAHLGVLRALEHADISVLGIAGTSGGALIAAMYASGHSIERICNFIRDFNPRTLSRHRKQDREALWGLSGWRELLNSTFNGLTFEDLKIPIAFPAVNLNTNQEEVLSTGSIVEALLASIAIPGIFPPLKIGDKLLIDGGILDPVPAALARALVPGIPNFAVVLMPPASEWHRHPFPQFLQSVTLFRLLGRLRLVRALAMYVRAADLSNRMLAETRLKAAKPDLVIRPAVDQVGMFDRVDIGSLMAAGELAAKRGLEEFFA